MALVFDSPTDEQVYCENISELYTKDFTIAKEIGNHVVVADTLDRDKWEMAQNHIDTAIAYCKGAMHMAEACENGDMARLLREIMLALTWSTVG